jgi:general secretion pathway protein F
MKTYIIKYQDNGIKEKLLETTDFSKEELPLNIISIEEQKLNIKRFKNTNLEEKRVMYLFFELNLMLQSNMVISDALDILIKNQKEENYRSFLKILKSSLTSNTSIDALVKTYKVNHLIIAFFKLSKNSGNIKENINALSNLLFEMYDIKKKFFKAIRYPLILVSTLIISFFSIFLFVLPKLKMLLVNVVDKSFATQSMFFIQSILSDYYMFLIVFLFFTIFLFIVLFKRNEAYKYFFYKLLNEKLYIIKDLYHCVQFYKIFLALSILLNSKYEFHQALKFVKVLLRDKYLLDRITLIENLLENGKSISYSFSQTHIFDDIVLNLISSAQKANSLGFAVEKIKDIYINRFYEKIDKLLALIEPIIMIFIVSLILWLVLAVFVPLWDSSNVLGI